MSDFIPLDDAEVEELDHYEHGEYLQGELDL